MSSGLTLLKTSSWLTKFRAFIMRGSAVDLAVGMIVGAAFSGLVNSLVKDVINPVLGLLVGGINFSDIFFTLNGQHYANLADAQHAGAPTSTWGCSSTRSSASSSLASRSSGRSKR
jgi:large conductance mechanosensitive channel